MLNPTRPIRIKQITVGDGLQVVFPVQLFVAAAFAKPPKQGEAGTPVFAMINKSGVRLMPLDPGEMMDLFFGVGEVQLYQVRDPVWKPQARRAGALGEGNPELQDQL